MPKPPSLQDNRHHVYLIHGQQKSEAELPALNTLVVNYEDEKPRKGKFQRFELGPAPVHRWGHYGVTYPDGAYEHMYDWSTKTLALAPSDIVYKDDKPITGFFHVDRGLEYTDHHAFFFKRVKPDYEPTVAHSAFETHDFDHVLGSQVFDYWFDTSKFILEHYADGDLVNAETEVSHVPAGPQALKIWGPPIPDVF
ncbi:hypothetical protein J4E89_007890 [Alternaria sp. Ai002NY15]|nr:hypothetical protein J4E89_007890 [Alternaria sp. Ai002NY15]